MAYDSRQDTIRHIYRVQQLLQETRENLTLRAHVHDQSKLTDPEKPMFDTWRPKLDEFPYGSDEYKNALANMGIALDHHYEHNSHHPEHYEGGINDMTLLDLLEMLADWKAASKRQKDGSMGQSLEFGAERFKIDPILARILQRTAEELGWI